MQRDFQVNALRTKTKYKLTALRMSMKTHILKSLREAFVDLPLQIPLVKILEELNKNSEEGRNEEDVSKKDTANEKIKEISTGNDIKINEIRPRNVRRLSAIRGIKQIQSMEETRKAEDERIEMEIRKFNTAEVESTKPDEVNSEFSVNEVLKEEKGNGLGENSTGETTKKRQKSMKNSEGAIVELPKRRETQRVSVRGKQQRQKENRENDTVESSFGFIKLPGLKRYKGGNGAVDDTAEDIVERKTKGKVEIQLKKSRSQEY